MYHYTMLQLFCNGTKHLLSIKSNICTLKKYEYKWNTHLVFVFLGSTHMEQM